jgi:hypothetical protein
MSIFSRLLKRGPEDGGTPPPEPTEQPAAAKPAPAPREAAPAQPPAQAPPPSASKNGTSQPEPKPEAKTEAKPEKKAAPPNGKAAMGVTKAYQAVKPQAGAPAPAPGMVPARNTPPRTVPVAPAPTPAGKPAPAPAAAPATPEAARAGVGPTAAAALSAAAAKSPAREENSAPTEAMTTTGSMELVFEKAFPGTPPAAAAPAPPAGDGALAASDRKAVMATFEELAVGHTAQVRSFMLEVRWGEAQTSWIELSRPALKSLRAMSIQMEHAALTAALDGFDTALAEMLRPGAPPVIGPVARDKLLAAYAPLTAVLPRAFELDGERDRREPMVVRALLQQVAGLDPLMVDKMMAAGLGRLDALFRARADEIAAVAGISMEVATLTAACVQAFKRATPAALATPDMASTARELGELYKAFEADHRAFEDAARGWSEGDREAKKRLRRQRELGFLQITIALVRLGEVDLALRLEKCSFARRLEELERLVVRLGPLMRTPTAAPAGAAQPADGQIREIEMEVLSGAHAGP